MSAETTAMDTRVYEDGGDSRVFHGHGPNAKKLAKALLREAPKDPTTLNLYVVWSGGAFAGSLTVEP